MYPKSRQRFSLPIAVLMLLGLLLRTPQLIAHAKYEIGGSGSVEPAETYGILTALTESAIVVNGVTYSRIPGSEINADLQLGQFVKVKGFQLANGTFLLHEVELDDHPQDVAEQTPKSPEDNPDSSLGENEFIGTIEAMTGNTWMIGGQPIVIDGTEIKGNLTPGTLVKVHFVKMPDGSLVAREIEHAGTVGASSNDKHSGEDDSSDDHNSSQDDSDNGDHNSGDDGTDDGSHKDDDSHGSGDEGEDD